MGKSTTAIPKPKLIAVNLFRGFAAYAVDITPQDLAVRVLAGYSLMTLAKYVFCICL